MNTRGLLIGLLLLAIVLVDLVLVAMAWGKSFPHAAITGAWALQIAQVGLAGIWLAFGRLAGPWRLLVVLGIVIAWSEAIARLEDAPNRLWWIWFCLAQLAATTVPLLIARAAGLQMVCTADSSATSAPEYARPRFQFSVGYLLAWTTAVAIALSTLQYLMSLDQSPLSIFQDWEWILIVFCLGHAAIAIAAFWLAFGSRWFPGRILTFLLTCLLATLSFLWLANWAWDDYIGHYVILYAIQAPLLLGPLAVVRIAGYRLQWYGQLADPIIPPSHHPDHERQ